MAGLRIAIGRGKHDRKSGATPGEHSCNARPSHKFTQKRTGQNRANQRAQLNSEAETSLKRLSFPLFYRRQASQVVIEQAQKLRAAHQLSRNRIPFQSRYTPTHARAMTPMATNPQGQAKLERSRTRGVAVSGALCTWPSSGPSGSTKTSNSRRGRQIPQLARNRAVRGAIYPACSLALRGKYNPHDPGEIGSLFTSALGSRRLAAVQSPEFPVSFYFQQAFIKGDFTSQFFGSEKKQTSNHIGNKAKS